MIPLEEQETLRQIFADALKEPVKIDLFTQKKLTMLVPGREECLYCDETRTILEEMSHLHPLLRLTEHEYGADAAFDKKLGVEHVPATVIRGVLNRPVTFYGLPIAALFAPIVETVALMSQNRTDLPAGARKALKRLREPVTVRVFASPDMMPSAQLVLTAFAFAVETKFVRAEAYEVGEFPKLIERLGIREIPYTIVNDRAGFAGFFEPATYAAQVVKAATTRTLTSLPRGSAAAAVALEAPRETVRPSGLIIPGR